MYRRDQISIQAFHLESAFLSLSLRVGLLELVHNFGTVRSKVRVCMYRGIGVRVCIMYRGKGVYVQG